MKRFKTFAIALIAIGTLTLAGCRGSNQSHQADDIEILRFDQLMFDTPAQQLHQELVRNQGRYNCQLLPVDPANAEYMAQIADFVQDPVVREIYDTVQAHYGNLCWLEHELTPALRRLQKAYGPSDGPGFDYTKFIAFVSGALDYDYRVAAYDGALLISIDQYVMPYMDKYAFFGLPMYIVNMCDSTFLLTDCLSAMAQQVVPVNEMRQMLDYMVAAGKTLYMLDIALPKADDRIKMRYTEDQMGWMKQNEADVWAYFVQHKLIFETDFNKFHNFVDEAPKTNAFHDSAPRTAEYIGWQIVRNYVQNTGCSLQQLLNETNSSDILQKSGYRP